MRADRINTEILFVILIIFYVYKSNSKSGAKVEARNRA
jgi:hypothetical protein